MSEEEPAVTVCIPVLNEAETIARVLSALNRQTLSPAAVVVVDGGSTDGTREIVRDYGAELVTQKEGGPAAARNVALRNCRTPQFATLDADAVPTEDWLETAVHVLREYDTAAVGAAIVQRGESLSARWRARRMPFNSRTDTGPIDRLPGNNVLFRTDALRDVGGWDESYEFANEDIDLCCRLRAAGHGLVYTPETTVDHYGVTGLEVVHHLWHWHSPDGGPDTYPELAARSVRHAGKSVKYLTEDLWDGKIEMVPFDVLVAPIHVGLDVGEWRIGKK